MLKISKAERASEIEVRLEGKLLEPWVCEVETACWPLDAGRSITLDLTEVQFVDDAGASLLRRFAEQGVQVVGCSDFIKRLLGWEDDRENRHIGTGGASGA